MPAATSIVVNDRETTPVAHTFSYGGTDPKGVSQFVNSNAGTIVGREKVTVSSRNSNGKLRVKLVLTDPVVVTEVVNSVDVPRVARNGYAELVLTFDEMSTLQERKNVVGMLENMLKTSQTALDAVLTNGEQFY